ncbi:MAG: 2Fe-2S iron-sulfur cluster-binding protein [Nitrospinota bacterium]
MYKVTFYPDNVSVETEGDISILELAHNNDIFIESNCGGFCACSTCHVIVKKGMGHLPEATEEEEDQLDEAEGVTLTSRLSCQCIIGANGQGEEDGELMVEIPKHTRNAPGIIGGHHH